VDNQPTSAWELIAAGEILAALALVATIIGAWIKDRLSINTKITAIDAKLDILITQVNTDRAINEQRINQQDTGRASRGDG
jgi:hypothetical protein